jgi:membrane protease YdiL (CAAX protease family)
VSRGGNVVPPDRFQDGRSEGADVGPTAGAEGLVNASAIQAWLDALPLDAPPIPARAAHPVDTVPGSKRRSPSDPVGAMLIDDVDVPTPARQAAFLVAMLALLTTAEYMVAFVDPLWGLALHSGLLLAFMVRAVFSTGIAYDLFVALSVLPLIRLLAIAMPYWLTDQSGHFALVNLPLIVATLVAASVLGYRRSELGLRLGRLPWQSLVALSGPLIGFLERLIIQPAALAPELTLTAAWWPALSLLLFTGLSEELLFRGLLQTAAVRWMGARWGILYVSLMFGALHIGWQSGLDVVFVALVGVFFGWVVHRTGSIVGVTLAHGFANIALFIVLPNLGMP